jgi:hypothetical protein
MNSESLSQGIESLYSNPSLQKTLAKTGNLLVKGQTWKDKAGQITAFAEKIKAHSEK